MRVVLKHIKSRKAILSDGAIRVYHYHRLSGKRIIGEPGTAQFLASYEVAARIERPSVDGDTLFALLSRYKGSRDYGQLAASTQREYDRHLSWLADTWGQMPIAVLDDRQIRGEIREEHNKRAATAPRSADMWLSVVARVLSFAVADGLIEKNHAQHIRKAYSSDRSDRIWLPSDVERFCSNSSPELQLALSLALATAQRQGDLLSLKWSAYDGTAISLVQSKTNRSVHIPLTRACRATVDAAPRRAVTILTTRSGTPWTGSGFRASWRKAAAAAGINDLHFHDLRGTAVTMLAEAGCTEAEIAAISGHSLGDVGRILDKYVSRTKQLARNAIRKREANDSATQAGTQRGQK